MFDDVHKGGHDDQAYNRTRHAHISVMWSCSELEEFWPHALSFDAISVDVDVPANFDRSLSLTKATGDLQIPITPLFIFI